MSSYLFCYWSLNYWFCYSIDLFGSEISTNAADFFASGLKGRWNEDKDYTEHSALNQTYRLQTVKNGALVDTDIPLRNAMNDVLRASYIKDTERVVKRWNQALEDEGSDERITLPNSRFFRRQGIYANLPFNPQGELIGQAEFDAQIAGWLPSDADRAYVTSLMKPSTQPGQMANWIAAPRKGIHGNPVEFEYVKHH